MKVGAWIAGHWPKLALVVGPSAIVTAAVLLAPSGGGGGAPALTPVAQAAERTSEYPGARMRLFGSFNVPGQGAVMTMEGNGAFNSADQSRIVMETTSLPAGAAERIPGGSFAVTQLSELTESGQAMYMRSKLFEPLPGGASWMRIEVDYADRPQSMDPRETLKMLRAASEVKAVGTERIRGLQTTHYTALVDQGAEVERLRQQGEDDAADQLEQAIKLNNGASTARVDVWVGPDDTVHRMEFEMPFELVGPGTTMEVTMDLFAFGADPQIEIPDESEVWDATELSERALENAAG